MNSSQFVTTIVLGAFLSLGGLGFGVHEWQQATTSQKVGLVHQSKLDEDQKAILTGLITTTNWPELKEALSRIRAEFAVKRNFTRNPEAKKAFSEVEENLAKLLRAVEDVTREQENFSGIQKKLQDGAFVKGLSPEMRIATEETLKEMSVKLSAREKELSEVAQSYLFIALQQTAEANKALSGELNKRSQGYLWGVIAAIGGVGTSLGAAVKMFFEVTKLRLECQKLRASSLATGA
jgi:hypothetical protein